MKLNLTIKQLILRCFLENKSIYLLAIVALYMTHYTQSYIPFLAKDLAELGEKGLWGEAPLSIYLGLAIAIIFFRTLSRLFFFYPARVIQKELKLEMIDRVTRTPPERYRGYHAGDLFQVLQNDFDQLRALLGFVVLQIGNILLALIVIFPKVVSFNVQLLWAFIPQFVSVALFMLILSKFQIYYRKTYDQKAKVQGIIIEGYEGKSAIKNYGAESSFLKLFTLNVEKELGFYYKASLGPSISKPIIELGIGATLLLGAFLIHLNNLGASTLILFSGFVFLLKEPLQFLSWIGIVTNESMASVDRIKKLVKILDEETDNEKLLKKLNPINQGSLEQLMNFSVPFWGEKITLHFLENQKNVVVSETGHGKTTLLLQMANILKLKGANLSLVFQAPLLFNDTLLKNIFLGHEPTEEDIKKGNILLELFFLKDLASSDEELHRLVVGENGKLLSGGQAKRLALVRSILSKAETLIWDDPFSSIDLIYEKKIMTDLNRLGYLKDKTLIFSTHRLTSVKNADYAVLVDKNQGIVESGDVKELLNQKGSLFEHFAKQSL